MMMVKWVQEEIETLKRAGVITKSMSPLGQSHCHGTKEISTWGTPQKEVMYRLQKDK